MGMTRHSLFIGVTMALAWQCGYAGGATGISFYHNDWELACDNTRTCRAAGYQGDEDELAVSVLLTRLAGPGQAVKGQLMIGNYDNDELLKRLPKTIVLAMKIDGKSHGNVTVKQDSLVGDLSKEQVSALLASLARSSEIEWVAGSTTWRLSDKGAAAVLLKMDDYQGRVGTIGALIKKGQRGEDAVAPAAPLPVVVAVKVVDPASGPKALSGSEAKALRDALRATIKEEDCFDLPEGAPEKSQIATTPLSNNKLLATTLCWRAAYNEGYGYWVINSTQPYNPILVTTSGSDYSGGSISSAQKGRGLGDCWSSERWTWDGTQFVHTESSTTGMCKSMAPGGAWSLPTVVSEVRHP
jgi:hypothetical protein